MAFAQPLRRTLLKIYSRFFEDDDPPEALKALAEPEEFRGDRLLVVGGGDSAVEAALALSEEPGTRVRVSYRRDSFNRIKPGNRSRLREALEGESLEVHWSTTVARIEPTRVWLAPNGTEPYALDNDQVLVFGKTDDLKG